MAKIELGKATELECRYYVDANNFQFRLDSFIFLMIDGELYVASKDDPEGKCHFGEGEGAISRLIGDPTYVVVRLIAATLEGYKSPNENKELVYPGDNH